MNSMDFSKPDPDYIRNLVESINWLNIPGFEYGPHECMRKGSFGYKAGPNYDFANLLHEVAHAVELWIYDKSRITWYGYEFHFPQQPHPVLDGEYLDEPITIKCLERELRTISIQALFVKNLPHLSPLPLDEYIMEVLGAMPFMPDWYLVPVPDSIPYADHDQAKLDYCFNFVHSYMNDLSYETIISWWPEILNHILTNKPAGIEAL